MELGDEEAKANARCQLEVWVAVHILLLFHDNFYGVNVVNNILSLDAYLMGSAVTMPSGGYVVSSPPVITVVSTTCINTSILILLSNNHGVKSSLQSLNTIGRAQEANQSGGKGCRVRIHGLSLGSTEPHCPMV